MTFTDRARMPKVEFIDLKPAINDGPFGGKAEATPPSDDTTVSEIPWLDSQPMANDLAHAAHRQQVFDALFSSSSNTGTITLGRYVVQGTLGRGSMGTVLKAFDPTLDRRVAIKVLHKELDKRHTIRLRREALALAKLSHPNVVQVYEVGEYEEQAFVVMERIKGQTLREWMHGDPRPDWRECIEMFLQIGAGLIAAHERGLVHRDFKPANAIVDRDGRPRVLDFGLARQAQDFMDTGTTRQQRPDDYGQSPLDDPLTGDGVVLGTPAYMSPEQMKGIEADPSSDQFSFCVALYEAVYGERPFEGTSMAALMVSMRHGKVRPAPKGTDVPSRLRTVLLRGLALGPRDRWPSMDVLLSELRRVMAQRPRSRWWALGLVAALAAATGAAAATGLAAGEDQSDASASQCNEDAKRETLWGDAARDKVKRAVSPEAWAQLEPKLDDYAQQWARQHTRVCKALEEHSTAALHTQMACIHDHETSLRDTLDGLARGEPTPDEGAIERATALLNSPPCDAPPP